MSTVAEIEEAIDALPPADFASLAAWFEERQAARMDAAVERAVASGGFDVMVEKALRAAGDGKTVPLDEFLRRP